MAQDLIAGIAKDRLEKLAQREAKRYAAARPKAKAALAKGADAYLGGVPLHWMTDWPMPHLPLVARAKGARLTDIDGYEIDDFCLGDTGSMFGHSPAPVAKAIRAQAPRGLTYMLPTEDALDAGRLLQEVFGPFRWQIATTATDANRFAIRVARAITGRPKILVFNGCYHGTVDDVMVELSGGKTQNRQGLMGQMADLTLGATAVEFNDLTAVEAALKTGEIAAILTEPVMTNSCMVLPDAGFHDGLRLLSRRNSLPERERALPRGDTQAVGIIGGDNGHENLGAGHCAQCNQPRGMCNGPMVAAAGGRRIRPDAASRAAPAGAGG